MSRSLTPTAIIADEPKSTTFGSATAGIRAVAIGLNQRRLLVVVALLGLYLVGLVRPTDIDFWWHVKTGELIAQSGVVPTTDPFSFTAAGRPWVVHEWLWELGVYELTRLGGFGLVALLSGLVVLAANVIIYRVIRALGVNELVAAILVLVAGFLALPSVGVRPREFTQLFLAYFVSRLLLYRMGRVRSLWGLPIAMAVWVNVHGPFILGLVVLGVFVLGALVEYAREWRQSGKNAPLPRHLLLVAVATIAATAINPRGPAMLLYPIGYYLAHDNPSFATVTEFQSPNFHDPLYLVFAATLLVFMSINSRKRDLTTTLLLVLFAAQALISVRNVAVYAPVAIPLLGERLSERFRWAAELKPLRFRAPQIALNWVLLALIVAGGIGFSRGPSIAPRMQLGATPNADDMPVAAARYVEANNLPGPIFNSQGWGGYLIYRWYPTRQVFVDGRVDMYGTKIVQDYLEVANVRPSWQKVLDRYGIQTILIEKDSGLSVLLLADPSWTRVYHDDIADVFVRRGPGNGG